MKLPTSGLFEINKIAKQRNSLNEAETPDFAYKTPDAS
jgi:hypothetical protein